MRKMDARIKALYNAADVKEVEDTDLMILWEQCAVFEEKVYDTLDRLSEKDRQIIEAYIDMRNELEFQSVKTALRYGRRLRGG